MCLCLLTGTMTFTLNPGHSGVPMMDCKACKNLCPRWLPVHDGLSGKKIGRLTGRSWKGEAELDGCSLTCHLFPLVRTDKAQKHGEQQSHTWRGNRSSFPGVRTIFQHDQWGSKPTCLKTGWQKEGILTCRNPASLTNSRRAP